MCLCVEHTMNLIESILSASAKTKWILGTHHHVFVALSAHSVTTDQYWLVQANKTAANKTGHMKDATVPLNRILDANSFVCFLSN